MALLPPPPGAPQGSRPPYSVPDAMIAINVFFSACALFAALTRIPSIFQPYYSAHWRQLFITFPHYCVSEHAVLQCKEMMHLTKIVDAAWQQLTASYLHV